MRPNRIRAKVSELANIVRERKAITFEQLCILGKTAPSTLYAYKKILLESCQDIEYGDGEFRVKKA